MEHRVVRSRRRAAAAACASLAWGLMLFLPGPADAGCVEGTRTCCVDENGCPGFRECVNGRFTECIGECAQPQGGPDLFTTFNSPPGTSVGICVDGADANGAVNDARFVVSAVTSNATFQVGELTSCPMAPDEVYAFAVGRAPTRVAKAWTMGQDHFGATLDDEVSIPVYVWVVQGPFDHEAPEALEAVIGAAGLFRNERTGVGFGAITLRDVTGHPNAASVLNVSGGSYAALTSGIGYASFPPRINIYWVGTVNGGSGNGLNWDGTPVIAVGHNADGGLLAHEFGHAFVLEHTDGLPGYDGTNVMASSATNRLFLTEGQNFRVHFHPSSQLNALFHARPDKPGRICSRDTASQRCLRNDKRVWADGAFPAN
jgi:hypothetical protein